MSAYLINRNGQELGTFESSQLQEGLETGSFLPTDLAWREDMPAWQGLAEIFGAGMAPQAKAISAPPAKPVRLKPLDINPYAAPSSSALSATSPVMSTGNAVPYDVIQALAAARPWMKFISILMGLLCVAFILSGIGNFRASSILPPVLLWLVAACCNYPASKLSKSAKAITRLSETRSFADLQAVTDELRRFWKVFGIACLIGPVLFILFGIIIAGGFR